jgi:hypothetical protein
MFLQLGDRRFDVTERPVVVGVLNRTRDSFFDRGAYFRLDRLLARAEQLVADGADVLEVGARPGGVGVAEVSPAEERDLAAETLAALRARFDLPLAVDTTRAAVAHAAFAEGAVLGNDMSGFLDTGYLPAAAAAGAAVVATHIRKPPGIPDPDPVYANLLGEVRAIGHQASPPGRPRPARVPAGDGGLGVDATRCAHTTATGLRRSPATAGQSPGSTGSSRSASCCRRKRSDSTST